jgi:hypothetical protein
MSDTGATALPARHAFRLDLSFAPPLRLPSLSGERSFFRVVEGTLHGARIRGSVVDDGGDWIVLRPDGTVETDSRMMIRTDDGALVYWRSRGVIRTRPDQLAAFRDGQGLPAGEAYYRSAPYFDAAVGAYDWLTKALFVASGAFHGDRASLDVYEVL